MRPWVPVVSLTKGLERDTLKRMSEIVREVLPGHPVAVLTGPNLAKEVLAGHPAASVVAIHDDVIATELQRLFSTSRLRVYTNPDIVGCEVSGVVKNVIAIAAGMAEGMGFGDNSRAALITRGLAEMSRLGIALGGQALTFSGLAGMGDLIATCSSHQSRNNTVGRELGKGRPITDVLAEMTQVAEGVKSSPSVLDARPPPRGGHADHRTGGGGVPRGPVRTGCPGGAHAPIPEAGDLRHPDVITLGALGSPRRARVTPWGAVEVGDRGPLLDWWVAADDRWHAPRVAAALRQRRLRGTPVVETVLRVPRGDVALRAYMTADCGGLLVLELENASPLPVAVAFSRSDLVASRALSPVPPVAEIEIPPGSVTVPLAHRTATRLALLPRTPSPRVGQRFGTDSVPHAREGIRPERLASAARVAAGWLTHVESAARRRRPGGGPHGAARLRPW